MANHKLIQDLKKIVAERFVIHLPEDLIVFEYDGSIDRALPEAVVLPSSTQEVSGVVKVCKDYGVAVTPRGAGTGLSGGAIALQGSVVLALTRMKRILEVDPVNLIAVVESGVVNLDLSKAVSKYGLYYAPDPSSQKACTLGGNVAENAGGPHCLAYGVTTNHILGTEVVLADGSIVWLGAKHRMESGYDLRGVFIGSEGTLGVVTKIAVRLLKKPEAIKTFLAIFKELDDASSAVSSIIEHGIIPAALEMMDKVTIEAVEPAINAGYPQDAGAVLLVELDGVREAVEEEAQEVREILLDHSVSEIRVAEKEEEREKLWAGRKGALGALGRLAPNYYLLDGVVPRTRLREVLARVKDIGEQYGLSIANVFHAGDGNLHPCILFDERKPEETTRALEAGGEILKLCVEVGGTLTGEHGVGLEKQEYMPLIFTDEDMAAMARLKPAFATDDLFNPGKVFPDGASCVEVPQRAAVSKLGSDAYV